jgi:hypothetical protein
MSKDKVVNMSIDGEEGGAKQALIPATCSTPTTGSTNTRAAHGLQSSFFYSLRSKQFTEQEEDSAKCSLIYNCM